MKSFVFNPFTGNFDEVETVELAPVGTTPNADAATLTGDVLNLEPADATFPGVVSTTTQSFSGSKTFLAPVAITSSVIDAALFGLTVTVTNDTTVDGSNNLEAIQTAVTATVQAGATNDKAVSGWVNTVQRGDGTDDGTLQQLDGSTSIVFHNSGAAGITNQVIGYDVAEITQNGTITDLYDFRAQRIPAGGTVTNHYGLYLINDSTTPIKSWLSGSTLFGKSSFSSPAAVVEIAGDLALDGATSGVFTQQAAAVTTDYTVSWPDTQGSATTALINDGAGNLSWQSVATGTSTFPQEQYNIGFGAGVDGSNNLIIVSTQSDGASAPTSGNPVKVGFNFSPGVTQYGYQEISSTAQQTLTVPMGATLGLASGINQFIYLYELYNTELAVSASLFEDYSIQSTATIGGGTNPTTIYSTVARAAQPIRLIGRLTVNEATAGVWATNPLDASVASYGSTSPQIPAGSFSFSGGQTVTGVITPTQTILNWDVTTYDNASAYSGGTYTIPKTGIWRVGASLGLTIAFGLNLAVVKNGVNMANGGNESTDTISGNSLVSVFAEFSAVAGDIIEIDTRYNNTSPSTISSTAGDNFFNISYAGSLF